MTEQFEADLTPLNAEKIGSAAHGKATFTIANDTLTIHISMDDTPANTEHWEHFHGFADGSDAQIATAAQDVNGDGYVDLIETGVVSGTTMVPFNDQPETLNIPTDTYPVSDANGHFDYTKEVPLLEIEDEFRQTFKDQELALDKRVVYIHGVPQSLVLPDSVAGAVGDYDAHVTLPIAVGKIHKI
ncbi:hypothetical protein [Furfurilactobacillus siliginis]|uniref:Uncharacterized protein n=1 Tax=Furfurilactobacillus siliginis TaxID=348151 RepID=A0A0R2L4E1_9LACO|nr:hypothetical protein [Furfurilactobacillus siliginis]KRN96433.1 hypothetical protein IV55_GL001402 [Furfurilactobacillus siliginis]GEK29185.1 hypothetical protein LSI01_14960 [Furfurilactobacillus siliginis]